MQRIEEWHEAWDGNVAVSFSGGKDSSVLLHLVRQRYPDVPAVFCHTGLEYPEVVSHVQKTENITIIRPKMNFREVITRYGWPIASKKIANAIRFMKHPTERNIISRRTYEIGINSEGRPVTGRKLPTCWRFLIDAPFEISDNCCRVMKKSPFKRYSKDSGRVLYVGMLASDSKEREMKYLERGSCNAFDSKNPKSTPLAFWTEQDILACIRRYNIPIAPVYGQIIERDGKLRTTGVSRTGCVFCAFGLHMDYHDGPKTRFEHLKETHPKLWIYVMYDLGLGDVLRYCRDHAPPYLAKRFRWGENPLMESAPKINTLTKG